jgi:hypothetical protein
LRLRIALLEQFLPARENDHGRVAEIGVNQWLQLEQRMNGLQQKDVPKSLLGSVSL